MYEQCKNVHFLVILPDAFPEVFGFLRCTFFAKMRNVFLHIMHEMCRNVQFFS